MSNSNIKILDRIQINTDNTAMLINRIRIKKGKAKCRKGRRFYRHAYWVPVFELQRYCTIDYSIKKFPSLEEFARQIKVKVTSENLMEL